MNLNEARAILSDDASSFTDRYAAVRVMVDSDDVELADLLECLTVEGVIAEMAAIKLHLLTGHPRDNGVLGVYLGKDDWEQYLTNESGDS